MVIFNREKVTIWSCHLMKRGRQRYETFWETVDLSPMKFQSFQYIHPNIHEIMVTCLNFILFFLLQRYLSCWQMYNSISCLVGHNASGKCYWHLCGTLTTAFWCFSPKNSLIQNMQLSFFSVNNPLVGNDCLSLACSQPSRLHNVSGKPAPVLDCHYGGNLFSTSCLNLSETFYDHCLSSCCCTSPKRA